MAQDIEIPSYLVQGFKFASQYFEGIAEVQSVDPITKVVTLQRYPKSGATPTNITTENMPLKQVVAGLMSGDYFEYIKPDFDSSEQEALHSVGLD